MNNFKALILLFLLSWISSCGSDNRPQEKRGLTNEPAPTLSLSPAELEDKVKGMLIGSAIGDAMGAPTEMWGRDDINREYGWVTQLDNMVREVSPEGIWKVNLPAGGTTDDTRWKKLTFEYMEKQNDLELDPLQFSEHILEEYEMYFEDFRTLQPEETEALEYANLRVLWLQEWYKVSQPLLDNNLMGYQKALGKFYGGEMVCAGLLYSPALGLLYPGQPEKAYEQAFNLSLFDLGYAKDISALSAGMTAAGMTAAGKPENMLDVLRMVDPESYFKSRLVGRSSYRILQTALSIVEEAKGSSIMENELAGQDEPSKAAIMKAFELLDEQLQDMPFHAGEIHLQVLTAMLFSDFEFLDTLVFLVNFGRDNDTTAAVAGAILGAYHGFENLPETMKNQVIEVNKKELDIDLIGLAEKQTAQIQSLYSRKE
ncbi:ADP-ribosylglycohydrolase family protein [Cyclobacterium plantarum]|uniref:ADP-ribosylglycohydrolase family protein n=1 Tax=Cyclobacterium plantarum TaxID=2716263 RepID=A0ABX0HF96_9BACT|nr:ADP-ribosylglycohydrolase family protein [Cyclobacterium plantarum]NHE59995.1 ADP-ribosylglycohydrolase family protein [Cyclobacterium plantarum]